MVNTVAWQYRTESSLVTPYKAFGEHLPGSIEPKASAVLPAATLGLCARIPVEALHHGHISILCVCAFVLFCVGRGLATGPSTVQICLPSVYKQIYVPGKLEALVYHVHQSVVK